MHRAIREWMGEQVETLDDLLRPELRAVVVGINPAPVSVRAGHYYQGRLGRDFCRRLESVGILPPGEGWPDDRALAVGIGFTDIIKRPTRRAAELLECEYRRGTQELMDKLERYRPGLLIFTFKKTATVLLGPFEGNGLLDSQLAGARLFVMPGPYAPADEVSAALEQLRTLL